MSSKGEGRAFALRRSRGRRLIRALWILSGTLCAVLEPSVARAECPNLCELRVDPPSVEPGLTCATWQTKPQTCDCAVLLVLTNGCDTPIEALDFSFDSCMTAAGLERDCDVVEPGARASWFLKLSSTGQHESALHVRSAEGEHSIHVMSIVESFDDGGCSIAAASPASPRGLPLSATAVVALSLAMRRRKRRTLTESSASAR